MWVRLRSRAERCHFLGKPGYRRRQFFNDTACGIGSSCSGTLVRAAGSDPVSPSLPTPAALLLL